MPQQTAAPVLAYHEYLGPDSQSVYKTRHYCGSCRRHLDTCYAYAEFPEDLEAKNEGLPRRDRTEGPFEHYAFCPWCGTPFVDEWWRDRTIQNERVIDHYQNPGTHKGYTHKFRSSPDNHWLAVSGGDKLCWCDPEVEPGIFGCTIRHRDKPYADFVAAQKALREAARDDDGYEEE